MDTTAYDTYCEGMALMDAGKDDEALVVFLRSLKMGDHFKTCERVAEILSKTGRSAEAAKYVERAYSLNPSNAKTATQYASLLDSQDRTDEALAILDEALKRNLTYGPALKLRKTLASKD